MTDNTPLEDKKAELERLDKLLKLDPKNRELRTERNSIAEELGEPQAIYVDTDVDPELDPNSPEFNQKKWEEAVDAMDLSELDTRLNEAVKLAVDSAERCREKIHGVMASIDFTTFFEGLSQTQEFCNTVAEHITSLVANKDRFNELLGIMIDSLAEMTPEELEELREDIDEQKQAVAESKSIEPEEKPAKKRKPRAKRGKGLETFSKKISENYIRQGIVTNELTKIKTNSKNTTIDKVTGTATATRGDLTVTITHYDKLTGLRTSTHQLLDSLLLKYTADPHTNKKIKLPLSEYMAMRGLSDMKSAREQVNADLDILFETKISFFQKKKRRNEPDTRDIRLCSSKGIVNGVIEFNLGDEFEEILNSYPVMAYPPELLKLKGRKALNGYYLGRKITEHKRMNAGKPNEDIISVKTLLEACPDLPSYAEVMETDRAINRRIIEPFENGMDALNDIFSWEFCHSKGEHLTGEEASIMDYNTFESCLVKTTWKDYPDQTERLKKRQEKIEQAEAKKSGKGRPRKKPVEQKAES